MIGIVSVREAQQMADSKNLDLVKIAPKANPPVCKIMDYGKYVFDLAKKEKEARKNQKIVNVKEVWIKPNIEEHDLGFKAKNAYKFLKDGDKVKVGVRFRGRELNYTSMGYDVLNRFAEIVSEVGTVDRKPKMEGRNMTMMLSPISQDDTANNKKK
jgi:translation initiation factor IF-3